MNKKIGIILVNYNGEKYNEECIESILNSTYSNVEIIVVDNKSIDNSVEKLELKYRNRIYIIKNNENLGFSEANNIGIKYAIEKECEYILLLNNDTVIEPDCIEKMIICSIENNEAVVSPKIYYYDNKDIIWSAGAKINWKRGLAAQNGINQKDLGQFNSREIVEFATGCCMLIPICIINDIGLLSDEYFLYYEDTDYCTRINRAGYKIIYEPVAKLYHKVSISTGGEYSYIYIYYNTRNRLIYNNKFNNENKITYIIYFYITRIIKFVRWLFTGKIKLIYASIDGIKDYTLGKKGKK